MGYVKQAIPDSVEEWWRNYRQSVKKAEIEKLGSDDITEHIEMAGWGVEEAERMNDGPGASKCGCYPVITTEVPVLSLAPSRQK